MASNNRPSRQHVIGEGENAVVIHPGTDEEHRLDKNPCSALCATGFVDGAGVLVYAATAAPFRVTR